MRIHKIIILFILLLIAQPALADGQGGIPMEAIVIIYLAYALVAAAIATVFSFLFKKLYEATRREKRKPLIWMIICTLVLPAIYAFAENEAHLLKNIGMTYGYEKMKILHFMISSLLVFIGFNVGYFITPKHNKEITISRSQRDKMLAILIQFIAWVIVLGFPFYWSISPMLDRLKDERLQEKQELIQNGSTMPYLKKVLDENYTNVRWESDFKCYKAVNKEGNVFSVGYDSLYSRYSMSYPIPQPASITDTLIWAQQALNLEYFLDAQRFSLLNNEIKQRQYSVNIPSDQINFAVEMTFPKSKVELEYYSELRQIIIRWEPAAGE